MRRDSMDKVSGSKSPTNIFSLGRRSILFFVSPIITSCGPSMPLRPSSSSSLSRNIEASGTKCFVDPLSRPIINWCVWRLLFLVLLSPSLAFIDRRPFIRPRPNCDGGFHLVPRPHHPLRRRRCLFLPLPTSYNR
eukprot:g149.t1